MRVVPRLSQLHSKRKRGEARPPKQFFDPLAWGDDARPMKDESGRWKFRGALYEGGLHELRVPINVLNISVAIPTRSELDFWVGCPDRSIAEFAKNPLKSLAEEFWVDDRVEVMEGDQQGRLGIVRRVDEKELSVLLWADMLYHDQELKVTAIGIAIKPSHVRKVFQVGDFVATFSGQEQELSGLVVAVDLMDEISLTNRVTVTNHGSDQVSGHESYGCLDLYTICSSPEILASSTCKNPLTSYYEASQITHQPSQTKSGSSWQLDPAAHLSAARIHSVIFVTSGKACL